jgi:drug/metabolite transporter superfamily protein YnfA
MRSRLILFISTAAALGLLVILPYRSSLVRLALIALWVLAGCFLLILLWRRKVWRTLLLIMVALLGLFVFLPGRGAIDTSRLRQRFVRQLQTYDGVRYIYGGENHRGIDCSGLVRAAMVRALVDESIFSFNPALLRAAFTLWWRDTNALQLGKGGKELTLPIGAGTSRAMRAAQNQRPGDLAVTMTGSHVLAYLSDQRWIEADPDVARVQIVDLNTSPIAGQEVLLVTWRWLR